MWAFAESQEKSQTGVALSEDKWAKNFIGPNFIYDSDSTE
jgi:hypothetical protein